MRDDYIIECIQAMKDNKRKAEEIDKQILRVDRQDFIDLCDRIIDSLEESLNE